MNTSHFSVSVKKTTKFIDTHQNPSNLLQDFLYKKSVFWKNTSFFQVHWNVKCPTLMIDCETNFLSILENFFSKLLYFCWKAHFCHPFVTIPPYVRKASRFLSTAEILQSATSVRVGLHIQSASIFCGKCISGIYSENMRVQVTCSILFNYVQLFLNKCPESNNIQYPTSKSVSHRDWDASVKFRESAVA